MLAASHSAAAHRAGNLSVIRTSLFAESGSTAFRRRPSSCTNVFVRGASPSRNRDAGTSRRREAGPSRQRDARFLLVPAIEQRRMADAADELAAGPLREGVERVVALVALHAGDPDLDQLVRVERAVCFCQHRFADAGLADLDDGLQRVAEPAQMFTLLFRERHAMSSSRSGSSTR